jgi:3-hydroxyacyl-[acyl-carrier-protein] dehydratase
MKELAGNTLAREIRKCMTHVTETDPGNITALFRFPADFIGFQGHFPDNPVLPGVCKIQAVVALFEARHQQPARLKEVLSAKFFAPVGADEQLTFEVVEETPAENEFQVRATISSGDRRVATLALRLILG